MSLRVDGQATRPRASKLILPPLELASCRTEAESENDAATIALKEAVA